MKQEFVLITTEWRGLFAGFMESHDETLRAVVITRARCAIDCDTTRGFIELASDGPNKMSKIGAEAPRAFFHGITSVIGCTDKARDAWLNHE